MINNKKPISISIINQKGGVGKTTSSLNISSFLALSGYKVLLVDLDPQGNASDTMLNGDMLDDDLTVYHMLMSLTDSYKGKEIKETFKFDNLVKKVVLSDQKKTTVDILPSNIKLSDIEMLLNNSANREKILKKAFRAYREEFARYDFIIIDCPPSLSLLTINAFIATKYLLVPVDASAYSHQGLAELVNSLGDAKKMYNAFNTELLGIFFAKYIKNETVYKESYKYLEEESRGTLFNTVINKDTNIEKATHHYKTILEYAPESRGAIDYKNLTIELLERINARTV